MAGIFIIDWLNSPETEGMCSVWYGARFGCYQASSCFELFLHYCALENSVFI